MKVLAITGGSGSGKSTVLNGLKDHFGKRLSMLSLDDYYRPKEVLPVDDNGETNFDVPEAIDHPQLHADILKLAAGEQVTFETYTYNKSLMKSEVAVIEPREWLVVEGLFVLCYSEIAALADVKAYIDASPEVRLARRKHRDMTVRGYTPQEVEYQWKHHVRPADLEHIEPCRKVCDVVIDNDEDWRGGLAQLIEQMEAKDA
ncbi:MAG: AAA family ATPase [Bacteroidota bacterium]|nr:AAA family ATPase [Bacteroidota bacterium]